MMNSSLKKTLLIGIAVLMVGGIALGAVALTQRDVAASEQANQPTAPVKRGPLTISVSESGTITARDQVVLQSEVEGRTTIIYLVPEGTQVEKGELLVELDASALQDEMLEEEIEVQNAEASFVQARENLAVVENQAKSDVDKAELDLELARMDLKKYEEGEYPNLIKEAESRITLAKEELERSAEKLTWSEKLFKEKYISQTELESDRLAKSRATLDHELAVSALKLLKDYTYKRDLAQLTSAVNQAEMALERIKRKATADVVQAEANLKAKEAEYEQQKSQLAKIKSQLKKTKIYAPQDGMVVYATSARGGWRGNDEPLDEGREVREREELIYLPSAEAMVAEVKVHESNLEKITTGMPVRITVEALQNRVYQGKVRKIAPLPDPTSVWLNPDLKVYNTQIDITGSAAGLRTGMTCMAEIIVDRFEDALYIPLQAVVRVGNKPTVYVQEGEKFAPRKVEVGLDNNRMIHVLAGLEEGERVLLTPPIPTESKKDEEDAGEEQAPQIAQEGEDAGSERGRPEGEGQGGGREEGESSDQGNWQERMQEMTAEDREAMRKRFENMSEEDRAKLRQQFQQRQGGG